MNHETEEMLTALLDGQLTADQEKELRARLENEPGLSELWEQLQSQRQLLRGLPRVKAPGDFLGKVAVALQDHASEVTLPSSEIEESGPRGGWRTVIALAAALAAVLLLGVFLWPRSVAQNSDQVASFDRNDRARQQEVEELKKLEKGDWVESAPVQRTPSAALPKAAKSADGSVGMPKEATADAAPVTGAVEPAQPRAGLGENLQAQAAPADALPSLETKRSAQRYGEAVDSAGKQAAEIAGIPQKMSEFKGGDPPALAANRQSGEVLGGFGAAAGPVGPVEVWIVEKVTATEPVAGEDKKVDASQVEVYFASVAETKLPDWLGELQSSATITRLDTDESRELLGQLAEQKQARERRADEKPAGVVANDLEGQAGLGGGGLGAAPNKSDEPAAQVGYLGLQEAAPLDALLTRSQQRQLASQKRVQEEFGGGGGVAGGAAGASAQSQGGSRDLANSSLESNLSNLRKRSVASQPLPQAIPPGGGRNVLIIIRER